MNTLKQRVLSRKLAFGVLLILFVFISSCQKDSGDKNTASDAYSAIREHTTIDPSNPDNYEVVNFPSHYAPALNKDNTPAHNPITDEGASLGRVLFYDVELSVNRTISCASCHIQSLGFTDSAKFSIGFEGGKTSMHSMRLVNAKFFATGLQFWDRRAASIEDQSTMPIKDHIEMGFDSLHGGIEALIHRMEQLPYYLQLFNWVFGDPEITEEKMQLALAQFVRSIISTETRFDEGFAQTYDPGILPHFGVRQDFPNFSEQENLGKSLYMTPARLGGAGCNDCHQAPSFAIGGGAMGNGLIAGETVVFKSPSLRNMALTGPYMHGGQIEDLMGVIEHYNNGVLDGPALDPLMRDPSTNAPRKLNLSSRDKTALLAFLLTLNDNSVSTDPRFSDPFR